MSGTHPVDGDIASSSPLGDQQPDDDATFVNNLSPSATASAEPPSIPASDITMGDYIADGQFNQVRLGKWRTQTVAIKAPKPVNGFITPEQRIRIQKEAKIGWRKQHKHIVQVYGVVDEAQLVMEYVSNETVEDMMDHTDFKKRFEASRLSWRLRVAEQTASAVTHMHQPPVCIHRDIKASNVFMSPSGDVKLGDFDRSCILEGQEHDVVGTLELDGLNLSNQAPEVIKPYLRDRRSFFSRKSDVYSLGLFILELLHFGPSYDSQHQFSSKDVSEGVLRPTINKEKCKEIGDWHDCADPIFSVVESCLLFDPSCRPECDQIYMRIKKIRAELEDIANQEDST